MLITDIKAIKSEKNLWNIINVPIFIKFWVRRLFGFPSWQSVPKPSSEWNLVHSDHFDNLDNWTVFNNDMWGSARPDELSVQLAKNVTLNDGVASIHCKKEPATGIGFEGESISREYTSGSIWSKQSFPVDGITMFRSKFRCQKDLGSWKAFWLFKNSGGRYQEIDGFEIFAHSKRNLKKWSSTVHWGPTHWNKTMFGKAVYLDTDDYIVMDIIIDQLTKLVTVKINGVTAYVSGIGTPDNIDEMTVIFGDSPSIHGGKVTLEEIDANLPYLYEIDYLEVYRKTI